MKYDIPQSLKSEARKYGTLVLQDTLGTTSGTFISTTSSITYTYTNETDLLAQLFNVLKDYLISATDWNTLTDGIGSTPTLDTTSKVVIGAINEILTLEKLKIDVIKGTTQTPTYANGNITQILHKDSENNTVRTDTFTYNTLSIIETRTLSTGETITIQTNFDSNGDVVSEVIS